MSRIAFVFSGQGDQHPGMGRALCGRYPAAAAVFERCDVQRPGTSEQCFSGPDALIRETKNCQPCLLAYEMAATAALESCGLKPDMAAGFSLGELGALTCGGALTVQSAFSLVCARGELMQRDAEKRATSMAAVLRLDNGQVEQLCAQFSEVYPVNYNCPGQISVSGSEEQMTAFCAAVKQLGGRALPLKVRGAFHSPFMRDAAAEFAELLEKIEFGARRIPVYSDVTAQPYPEEIAPVLARQICAPVRWEAIIRNMISDGADVFVEIGPGKTLCNLISRIQPNVRVFAVSAFEDLEALAAEVKAC